MPVNQGGSALKGIYLGDQLLTGGGGDPATDIQTAITTPDPSALAEYIKGLDNILNNTNAMTAVAGDKPSLDAILNEATFFKTIAHYYPQVQDIINASPHYAEYLPGGIVPNKVYNGIEYCGTASSSEFGIFSDGAVFEVGLNASSLATQVGVTQGTVHNAEITWHKFINAGKTIYIAEKTVRYGISWNALNRAGCVSGSKIIRMTAGQFKVRLLSSEEWDLYMCGLSNGNFASLPDSQLAFLTSGAGSENWTSTPSSSGDRQVTRYEPGGASSANRIPSDASTILGWRPALEFTL